MKMMRCFLIFLMFCCLHFSFIKAYNNHFDNKDWRRQTPFYEETHIIKKPLIRGILYEVTRTENGNRNTTLETSFFAKASLATVGLGVVCGYYYGMYKGLEYLAGQTGSFFSSLSDLHK